jgi:hypothetical protein
MWGAAAIVDHVGFGFWQLGGYGTFHAEWSGVMEFAELGAQLRLDDSRSTVLRAQLGVELVFLPVFVEVQKALTGEHDFLFPVGFRLDITMFSRVVFYITHQHPTTTGDTLEARHRPTSR